MNSSVDFLSEVWGHSCREGDFVFLASKSADTRFTDHRFVYGRGLLRRLKEFFSTHPADKFDLWFCPTPFTKPRRLKANSGPIRLLWSDLDNGRPKITPSVLWESSPARLQALWFLGIAAQKAGQPEEARRLWGRMRDQFQEGSAERRAIEGRMSQLPAPGAG